MGDHRKKLRGVYKGSITRHFNYACGLNDNSTDSLVQLETRLEHVKQSYKDFLNAEDKLFQVNPDEESQMEEVEEKFITICGVLNQWIRKRTAPETGRTEAAASTSGTQGNPYNDLIKLPKCQIPPFSGDYMQWQSFHDLFTSAIHRKEYLSQSQKLQYLKGLLQGEAEVLLRHFSVTDANYELALKKLKARYDRKRPIVNAFIKTFIEQPAQTVANATSIKQIFDSSDEVIRGLNALGAEAERRDPWLIYIMLNKLDAETRGLWARASSNEDFPSIENFLEFLGSRMGELEAVGSESTAKRSQITKASGSKSFVVGRIRCCPICQTDEHKLFECEQFQNMTVAERRELIREERRCYNCLNFNHSVRNCKTMWSCKECRKRHHTMLHEADESVNQSEGSKANASTAKDVQESGASSNSNSASCYNVISRSSQVILPTAMVKISSGNSDEFICRALLDSSSQESFITEECAQRIGMRRCNGRAVLTGLGDNKVEQSRGRGMIRISGLNEQLPVPLKTQVLVIPKITSTLPSAEFEEVNWSEVKNLQLADARFNKCSSIDLLLGTEIYYEILADGKLKLPNNLVAQNTKFGWTIAGKLYHQSQPSKSFSTLLDIDRSLRNFWELEELPAANQFTAEELECEEHFVKTTSKAADDKFVVALPFSDNTASLGATVKSATSQLIAMERRFKRNPKFKEMYVAFIDEYCKLGHMEEFTPPSNNYLYYLPHHGVLKDSSTTTKLRVVFNASFKSDKGNSLNDILKVGPTIQSSLLNILIRFRQHKYVIVGDVEKMYRQIWVDQESASVQNIVWRNNDTEPLRHYRLRTITYGTASASFIATRCLHELATQHQESHPIAAKVIKEDVYMDDLMTGASTTEALLELRADIIQITESAKFHLRKWSSNSDDILSYGTKHIQTNLAMEITSDNGTSKLLGLAWDSMADIFKFQVKTTTVSRHTKRTLLSEASQVFDPLGWLSPVVVRIKILFQGLWLQNLHWDDELPEPARGKWIQFRNDLNYLNDVEIPRWLETTESAELHGFCDASNLAYAGAVYVRVKTGKIWSSQLIAAKTKVAPIKQISIPRLELMGALLLTRLMTTVKDALRLKISRIVLWTDAKIVLDWLAEHPRRWPTFVGNRTSEILQSFSREHWRHVKTTENPADVASRGEASQELGTDNLWWNGPTWLRTPDVNWSSQEAHYGTNEEARPTAMVFKLTVSNGIIDMLVEKFAKFSKMVRVYACIQRFVRNARCGVVIKGRRNAAEALTAEDIQEATNNIVRYVQMQQFPAEYDCLKRGEQISPKSKILSLRPFMDEREVIRVGGRISKSFASFSTKHPIVLAPSSPLSKAIMLDFHERYYHAGIELTMSIVRTRFWIVRARDCARAIIRRCVKCIKQHPKMEEQIMGDLPQARVEYDYPFKNVGVDYAGPFKVHPRRRRGQLPMKTYICIFVCLSTKAVHIEVACELTTDSFLAALNRFVARRGVCSNIFSDNGTNFVGANNQLKDLYLFLQNNTHYISSSILRDEINWHFNPPAASHMGGIYEAAVKSAKTHLRRVVGDHILTLEEFTTLMTQIESVLNCRPLCASKSDSEIQDVLTPAHFLIGRPLIAIPEVDVMDARLSPLARWDIVKKMRQHFWQRWHREYLTTLQTRTKWKRESSNLNINDIVIVKDENLPANQWAMARVVNIHPGDDKKVRVVSIRIANGSIMKRPIHKLCRLPILENIESTDSTPAECSGSSNI